MSSAMAELIRGVSGHPQSDRPLQPGRITRFRVTGASVREALLNEQISCKEHAYKFGIDQPEITDWKWSF